MLENGEEGATGTGVLIWEGIWLCLGPEDCVRLRTAAMDWNEPKKYGPYGELVFFLNAKRIQSHCQARGA